jgi:hypothetical protein
VTVPTTRLVETLEMWHTLVLLAGFVASQRFPSGSSGSVATLSSAAWVLFAGGPVARWRIGDAPLLACAMNVDTSHQTYKLVSICYCLHAKGSSAPDCARDPTTCHKPLSLHTKHTSHIHVPSSQCRRPCPALSCPRCRQHACPRQKQRWLAPADDSADVLPQRPSAPL